MVKDLNVALETSIKKPGKKITKEFLNMGSITNLKTNKTLFIPCGCRSEILVIEYDHHLQIADLAIYQTSSAFGAKMSLWQRVLYCWQVLAYKKPYADEIVLDNKQLLDLKEFIASLNLIK